MSAVLLSQLAHAELISPRPEETARWMTDVLGLEETTREGQSDYLRGWAEWLHSSLVVTEGPEPAVGHIAWRAYGPGDPEMGGARGRVNHLAYRLDQRLDVERAAEVLIASGTPIEFGPGIHGCDEITYVYAREPSGFRIEVNSGGWVNQEPDFPTTTWRPEQGGTTLWKNVAMPESMMESFPSGPAAADGMRRTGLFAES